MANRGVRVAGGAARGVPLAEPKGFRLRPTSGLVREAIFNILATAVEGARILDLYAGTGALGIESLSRGAARATFVEGEAACVEAILQSLARTGFSDRASVLRARLPGALDRLDGLYDLIFLDPPYDDPAREEVLARLSSLLAPSGLVVYEHGSRYNPPVRPLGLELHDRRVYGDTAVAFYRHFGGGMRIAVYPGGFDPVTNGHLDLIVRMTHLFDRVIVAVVKGRDKATMFTWEERIDMVKEAVANLPTVEVEGFDEMTVEFAKRKGAVAIVRGIRAVSDFEVEFDMAMMNRKMAPHLESVFLMANQEFLYISASRIREVSRLGYDVADLVPPHVRAALRRKLGQV